MDLTSLPYMEMRKPETNCENIQNLPCMEV